MQLFYSHVMCVSAQKNTHYLLVFDSLVIIVCLTSAVLCARSMILALRLLQVTCSVTHYHLFLFFTATFLFFFLICFFLFRFQVFCPCLSFLDWLGKCLLPIYTNIMFYLWICSPLSQQKFRTLIWQPDLISEIEKQKMLISVNMFL